MEKRTKHKNLTYKSCNKESYDMTTNSRRPQSPKLIYGKQPKNIVADTPNWLHKKNN